MHARPASRILGKEEQEPPSPSNYPPASPFLQPRSASLPNRTFPGKRFAPPPSQSRCSGLNRFLRSSKFLIILSLIVLIYLIRVSIPKAEQVTKIVVPMSLLPILKKSSEFVGILSPNAAVRLQNWHDSSYKEDQDKKDRTLAEMKASTQHTFDRNGLLLVNPKGTHPIHTLIKAAQSRWQDKVTNQSKTLPEAVKEYKKRYKRNPPRGFDAWWAFTEKHNVQLRDEYDQIHHDMAPHWALEPADSRHRNRVMQEREHSFTVAFQKGKAIPSLHGPHADLERATDLADLFGNFGKDLWRELNMTFIIDDNPAVMLAYAERDRMVELSGQGEYYGPSEFVSQDDSDLSNFARACASNSPLRRAERGEFITDFSSTSATRSFIWDHSKAADLCQHPEARKLHGHTMQQGVTLGPLVPLFTFAKTRLHADILSTPMEQFAEHYIGYEPEWSQKSINKLLWRGSTTGVEFNKHTPWRLSQRARLHMMSQEMEGTKSVIWSQLGLTRESNLSIADLNNLYMDTAFSGVPHQCDLETCKIMEETINFKPLIGLEDSNLYKYLMDVDGNGWSGRFHRLMSTRSLVLKSTIFPEWYQDRIEPWVHYVPIKIDYSDLYDIMAFFIGTPDGQGGHDSIAEKMAESGRVWAGQYWRKVDMAAYMYRLILEYSRILGIGEGEEVDYIEEFGMNI